MPGPSNEFELYEGLLCGHLEGLVNRLRQLAPEHWDWTPDVSAPSPRTVAVHAWQWLQCDRQHINEPDCMMHSDVAEPPADNEEFCIAFAKETEQWRQLLRTLTARDLERPVRQFGNPEVEMNVRWFIGHMIQNVIYKHGQFSVAFYALGYDGKEPYAAPFPNPIYEYVRNSPITPPA